MCGIKSSELRRELLRDNNLTLQTAEEECRAFEKSASEDSAISNSTPMTSVKSGDILGIDTVRQKS